MGIVISGFRIEQREPFGHGVGSRAIVHLQDKTKRIVRAGEKSF